jgi:hypothetical protein
MTEPLNTAKMLCACAALALCPSIASAEHYPDPSTEPSRPVGQLIPWLLDEKHEVREIDFQEVIFAATGKQIQSMDLQSEVNQRVIKQFSGVLDEAMKRMNAPESPMQNVARINEVSSHVEDLLRELLNAVPGLSCDFPHTAQEHVQRSGYPDLRIVDLASQRVFFLDPKLYAADSRDSSFRTFYFEPKITTNKVRDDAAHLLVGFEHTPRTASRWNVTRWTWST